MEPTYPQIYLYKRIVQAKMFIDNNFDSRIDLSNIASEACFSRFHFLRLFKNVYGKTPHQYLIHKRTDKAKELLKEGLPVAEVTYLVGFDSLSSFSMLFKKVTGQAPSVYQQYHQRLKGDISVAPLKYIPGCFSGSAAV
jgi:AraC-like DNA-binding protein